RSASPAVRRGSIPASRPAAGTCSAGPPCGSPTRTGGTSRSAPATGSNSSPSLSPNSRLIAMNGSENLTIAGSRAIDLNADLGEGCPNDRVLLEIVTSASVCCGAHAGCPEVIHQTLCDARARGAVIGAHPGYPDRAG